MVVAVTTPYSVYLKELGGYFLDFLNFAAATFF